MRFSKIKELLELEADQVISKSNPLLFLGRNEDIFVMTINKKSSDTYEHQVIYLSKGNRYTYYFHARESFDFVQRIQDQWLFIRNGEEDKEDLNASIFSNDGKLVHQFHAGTGITDCQVDADGDIWLIFSDEGIFSQCELSQYGIVCLDKNGSIKSLHLDKYMENDLIPPIADSFSLNVMNNSTIWYTYYSGDDYDFVVNFTKDGNILCKGNIGIEFSNWISGQGNYLLIGNCDFEISAIDLSNNGDLIQENHFDNKLDFEKIVTRDKRIVAIKNNTIYDLIP